MALTGKQRAIADEALGRAQGSLALSNYPTIIREFSERGIPIEEIKPRENVLTFHAWKAIGRYVKRGEYTGEAWHGPVAGAVCACGSTKSVNQLYRFSRGEVVAKLDRFQCLDCSNAVYRAYQAKRKAQLAAEPRCEVPGCNARGNWRTVGNTLLCGRHLKAAQREHNRRMSAMGGMALFMGNDALPDKLELLKMTQS